MLADVGTSLTILGSCWVHFGALGPVLGHLGAHLGSSWALLGTTNHAKTVGKTMFCDITLKIIKTYAYFTILHPCCGHLGRSQATSWAMLSEVGALLGCIYGQVVPSWARVGPSWLPLGVSWAYVEPGLGQITPSRAHVGRLGA